MELAFGLGFLIALAVCAIPYFVCGFDLLAEIIDILGRPEQWIASQRAEKRARNS
jgi:hypothetical protein